MYLQMELLYIFMYMLFEEEVKEAQRIINKEVEYRLLAA
jgi:hypothetical protein